MEGHAADGRIDGVGRLVPIFAGGIVAASRLGPHRYAGHAQLHLIADVPDAHLDSGGQDLARRGGSIGAQGGGHLVEGERGPGGGQLDLGVAREIGRGLAANVAIDVEQAQFGIEGQAQMRGQASALQAVIAEARAVFPGGGDARVDLVGAMAHEEALDVLDGGGINPAVAEGGSGIEHQFGEGTHREGDAEVLGEGGRERAQARPADEAAHNRQYSGG